ncbi:hypothetical protein KC315_g35 [Hortaea werneckii]|nr:hypothetical protein KC315_g35 [Hortaea werneckii]
MPQVRRQTHRAGCRRFSHSTVAHTSSKDTQKASLLPSVNSMPIAVSALTMGLSDAQVLKYCQDRYMDSYRLELTSAHSKRLLRLEFPKSKVAKQPSISGRWLSMAPPCAALAQSESKARFFERLGLRDDDQNHRSIYTMMKVRSCVKPNDLSANIVAQEEAVEGRRRLTEDKEALLPELRNTGLEPPYSHAHVTETAIHREILRIYQRARPETRQVYDLGRDLERVEEENWVIRWMLWHVFRKQREFSRP